jgi:hypothetical protein
VQNEETGTNRQFGHGERSTGESKYRPKSTIEGNSYYNNQNNPEVPI